MKAILISSIFAVAASSVFADEVYFDTVSTEHAYRPHGAYFSFGGGAAQLSSADLRARNGKAASADEDTGWIFGLKWGYAFNLPVPVRPAAELEFMYIDSEVNKTSGSFRYRSDTKSLLAMANFTLALDLSNQREDVGDFWADFHPYVGAGFGGGYVWQDNIEQRSGRRNRDRDSRTEFSLATNWFVGVEYDFSETFSVYAEYKRVNIDDFGGEDVSNAEIDLWTVGFKFQY